MKKFLILLPLAVLGALFANSGWKLADASWIAVIFEDKIRLAFLLVCAVVLNFVYYASAPPGVSKWFYMDFKKLVVLLLVFVIAQFVFNFVIMPN